MNDQSSFLTDLPRLIYQREHNNTSVSEGQCDCACATYIPVDHQLAKLPLVNQPYLLYQNPSFLTLPLIANYYIIWGRDTSPIVLNQAALTLTSHFKQARYLEDIPPVWRKAWGDEVMQSTLTELVSLGLLAPEGRTMPSITQAPALLSAWLHITDRCNLRCSYCYLSHKKVDMSFETGCAAIEATFRSARAHNYSQVKLKYAGGEALLRFPFIADLHTYAQTRADQHGIGLEGVILSNGTLLTPEIVATIQSLGLRLMISLDGLGESHDSQRFYANGRGSSGDVTRAIDLALDHGLVPDISITISGRNAEGLPLLMEWVLERDLPFSLNFYRENDFSTSQADLKLEEEKIINAMLAAYKVIEANLLRRSVLASLVDRANLAAPHLRTCSVGDSYLVFDYLGQVSKCQMQIDKPVTTAGVENPLALIRADKLGIQNISVEEKEGCRDCKWKYWCTGGCPVATYRATGRYDVKSPNCNIYKTLYPEAVRLEGLRLLKYADELMAD